MDISSKYMKRSAWKMDAKISVIIPVYNAEKYIARCLNSILENTYHNLEVLCINDGSTDQSEKIIQNFADRDNRIKILNQSNQGVSAARNCGLDAATGDYIAFIDADDWVHKQYFDCLLNACVATKAPISVSEYCRVSDDWRSGENDEISYKLDSVLSVKNCFHNFSVKSYVWGRIIERNVIGNIRFNRKIAFGEDSTFMLQVLCENPDIKVSIINNILYYYYQKVGELTGQCAISDAHLPRIDAYLKYVDSFDFSVTIRQIIIEETIKKLLTYRYEAYIERKYTDARHNFNVRFSTLQKDVKKFPFKKRIMYEILGGFPFVYRALRIMQDKTLLEWEKQKPKLLAEYNANHQES